MASARCVKIPFLYVLYTVHAVYAECCIRGIVLAYRSHFICGTYSARVLHMDCVLYVVYMDFVCVTKCSHPLLLFHDLFF